MGKDLSHLTSEQVETLINRYYAGETVSKLLKEYNITINPSQLYKLFPPEKSDKYTCEYCKVPLVKDRPSKTAVSYFSNDISLYCPVCGHTPFMHCSCKNCQEKERVQRVEMRAQIKEHYSKENVPIEFYDLSFKSKVFLGALCGGLIKEDLSEIIPYSAAQVKLTPTDKILRELYINLIEEGAIVVSPKSPLEAFPINKNDFPKRYNLYKVIYNLNLSPVSGESDIYKEILNPTYYSSENAEEALELWREIAVEECVEYLLYQLKKVKFDFTPGEKTYETFGILLNDFSVSQIYGIIWRSVADASKQYLERKLTKIHAANCVIGACERYAGRAKTNGWELSQYNRPYELPQSELSRFYFDRVLNIGDMGFRVPPTVV